jgi:hypothetical protein
MEVVPGTGLMQELDRLPWEYPLAMMSKEEVWKLYLATKRLNAKSILELGTGFAYGTRGLGFGALETGGRVWTVDSHLGTPPAGKTWYGLNNEIVQLGLPVTFIEGNDLEVPLPGADIDLLFIDTLHYYDHLKKELARYAPIVSRFGEIFVHGVLHKDVHMMEENRAILEFLQTNKKWDYQVLNTEFGLGRLFPRPV